MWFFAFQEKRRCSSVRSSGRCAPAPRWKRGKSCGEPSQLPTTPTRMALRLGIDSEIYTSHWNLKPIPITKVLANKHNIFKQYKQYTVRSNANQMPLMISGLWDATQVLACASRTAYLVVRSSQSKSIWQVPSKGLSAVLRLEFHGIMFLRTFVQDLQDLTESCTCSDEMSVLHHFKNWELISWKSIFFSNMPLLQLVQAVQSQQAILPFFHK